MKGIAKEVGVGGESAEVSGQGIGYEADLPSYLHGWRFLSLIVADDEEAIAMKAWASPQGPAIVVNPMFVAQEDLESPSHAVLWLPSSLTHIAHLSIIEALRCEDGVGFTGDSWADFRETARRHTGMDWAEIVEAARREGVDYMAEHVAACMFVESGVQHRLMDRAKGRPGLRIA